jgi:hypothetical protein
MAVLEAQACGVPALVSDSGGPQEIVLNTVTGYVLPAGNTDAWVRTVVSLVTMMTTVPEQFIEMKHRARDHVVRNFSWVRALNDLVGIDLPATLMMNRAKNTARRFCRATIVDRACHGRLKYKGTSKYSVL